MQNNQSGNNGDAGGGDGDNGAKGCRDRMADWFMSKEGTKMCPWQFQMALRTSLRTNT